MTTAISFNKSFQTTKTNNDTQNLNFTNNFNWSASLSLFSESTQQMQMMILVMQVLQQLMQQLNQRQDQANPTQAATPLTLSQTEKTLLQGSFGEAQTKLQVLDGANQDGKLTVGDTLIIQNENGQELKRSTLSNRDIYDLRFRENMLKNGLAVETGWEFTDQLVSIKDAALAKPELREFTNANGSTSTERVLERNQFWEVVERDGNRYLLMRTSNDQNQAVQASDAINDLFNHREAYAFDCASPMSVLNLKASLDTIGTADFNRNAGQLMISSWFDQYDNSQFDGGYIAQVRTAAAGEVNINGVRNLAGETALFDPSKGDKLIPGNAYYFDLPGDNTSSVQGWNALYLGQDTEGHHQFWSSSIGKISIDFANNTYLTAGQLSGYYLGAVVSDPNTSRLQAWDDDGSVVR